jgi:hypothetical protein
MSAELSSTDLGPERELTGPERRLLALLLDRAGDGWNRPGVIRGIRAQAMSDGGMGSLRLSAPGTAKGLLRHFGGRISELQFKDTDGVTIIASLNVDDRGDLFELDIWKTDFTPVVSLEALG